jgi:hypothetical protein
MPALADVDVLNRAPAARLRSNPAPVVEIRLESRADSMFNKTIVATCVSAIVAALLAALIAAAAKL